MASFVLVTVLLFCVCAFVGCNQDVSPEDAKIHAIYDLYAENCAAEGETPLTYDAWLASIKGAKGDAGPQGPKGDAGKDGNGWLYGDTEPASSLGKVGDLYLNYSTWDVYTKEAAGWTLRGNIKGEGCSTGPTFAAGTETYYAPITAASGTELLGQIHDLITTTHTYYASYSDCRDYAPTTDYAEGGKSIVEFYTHETIVEYTKTGSDAGRWNREHVWPKSLSNNLWKGSNTVGGGADMHHIRPSEVKMNGVRGDDLYGEVTGGSAIYSKTVAGADSKLGGYHAGGVFEPNDNVKGDVARILFYVYTHYNTYANVHGTTNGNTNGQTENYFGTLNFTHIVSASSEAAAIELLLRWNALDPVDEIETKRNEEVFKIQHNRNPFIDHPELASAIWAS